MEALALLPILIMLFVYLLILGFSIWFAVSLISAQKDRNVVLREISSKLDVLKLTEAKDN